MKFSIKDFFSKCEQIRSFLQFPAHFSENFIFCALNLVFLYNFEQVSDCWMILNRFWSLELSLAKL